MEQYAHLLCGVCNMSKHVSPFFFRGTFLMKHAQCRARGNNIVWDLFDVFPRLKLISLREFMLAVH